MQTTKLHTIEGSCWMRLFLVLPKLKRHEENIFVMKT